MANNYSNNRARKFLEWFTYSDNSIDGQSKKYEKNIVAGIQAVVRTSRQPW
ncbi:MAG: hypothetical protein K5896_04495 [Prevotella sp.]|nr:hypothetical protein [Prevotella sp.]